MSKNIIIATDINFQKEVLDSDIPVLVDFWAPWCGPCRMIEPIVEELASEYSGILKVAKLNTDENMDAAINYSIRSIPTLCIFQGGKLVDTITGAVPKKTLITKLDQYLKSVVMN